MSTRISLAELHVIKDLQMQEYIMSSLEKEDLLTYCICDFMLSTGNDLKNTLLLTYEQLYTTYQNRLVPVANLYAGSRLIYFDKECGLFSILSEKLSGYLMQAYSGVMNEYIFSKRNGENTVINRSSMARKISYILEKIGYISTPSLFKNTFGYRYFCKYHTLIGTPFSYLCYRKDAIKKTFCLSDSEYDDIIDHSLNMDEIYLISAISSKIRLAYTVIQDNQKDCPAASAFLRELTLLSDSFDG